VLTISNKLKFHQISRSLYPTVKNLLSNKTLQRVKGCLRREARKPIDMGVKQCIMHICRIKTEEIAHCPPAFDDTQCLTPNKIINILLFGAPKSWQREMDHQGFDPLASTVTQVVEFMERIEMSEDFDGDKKVAPVTKKGNNNKNESNKGNSGADGSKHCVLHGNNNTHDASEYKTLMAQAKKLKGNNSANQKVTTTLTRKAKAAATSPGRTKPRTKQMTRRKSWPL